jgi:hypothetical protein
LIAKVAHQAVSLFNLFPLFILSKKKKKTAASVRGSLAFPHAPREGLRREFPRSIGREQEEEEEEDVGTDHGGGGGSVMGCWIK